jgi:hypothetical protein
VRHADAGAEPGGLTALAAQQAEGRAAGLEEEMDQVVDGRRNAVDAAAAVGAVDAGTDEEAEDAVAAAVAAQAEAVVPEDGVMGGVAAVGKGREVVADDGHQAQVVYMVNWI